MNVETKVEKTLEAINKDRTNIINFIEKFELEKKVDKYSSDEDLEIERRYLRAVIEAENKHSRDYIYTAVALIIAAFSGLFSGFAVLLTFLTSSSDGLGKVFEGTIIQELLTKLMLNDLFRVGLQVATIMIFILSLIIIVYMVYMIFTSTRLLITQVETYRLSGIRIDAYKCELKRVEKLISDKEINKNKQTVKAINKKNEETDGTVLIVLLVLYLIKKKLAAE